MAFPATYQYSFLSLLALSEWRLIFQAITALIQLVILVALTGVLVSVAAVARLMEVTISFIYPMTLFMLHQSGKLVILMFNVWLSAVVGESECKTDVPCVQKNV